jgi:maleate cis-trans isomerase
MPDRLGYRAKMAVVVRSTNTVMEPDLLAMALGRSRSTPHVFTLGKLRCGQAMVYAGQ